MFGAQSVWTEERTEIAKRLWFSGHSASKIADTLGGITRNAVIGKMNRIGAIKLKKERKPYKPKVVKIPAEVREVVELEPRAPRRMPREALPPEPPRPDTLVSFDDLTEKTCRFIYGDVRDPDHGFCPCERVAGSSYCAGHHGKCFTAPAVMARPSSDPGAVFNRFGRGRLREEVLA